MEENSVSEIEKKDDNQLFNWKKMFWWVLVLAVISGFVCVLFFNNSLNNEAEAEKYKQLYKTETLSNLQIEIRLDSAMKAMKQLASYQPLTSEMIQRDKVRSSMKYQPGDFAIMKVDSSKVLVIDIIAGGDKFNYTLKYLVQHKNKNYEEVSPQLLY
ncbi:MAG: hypothetical protein WAZ12_01250 [Candidatus Absconditicoccaceae bacterium]